MEPLTVDDVTSRGSKCHRVHGIGGFEQNMHRPAVGVRITFFDQSVVLVH